MVTVCSGGAGPVGGAAPAGPVTLAAGRHPPAQSRRR